MYVNAYYWSVYIKFSFKSIFGFIQYGLYFCGFAKKTIFVIVKGAFTFLNVESPIWYNSTV